MKSLSVSDVHQYCLQPAMELNLSADDILFYREDAPAPFFVKAPSEMRQILRFLITLTGAVSGASFGGGLLWLQQYHAGAMDTAKLGWRVIENLRLAHGDGHPLDVAPGQHFRTDEETELQIFLLQAIMFDGPVIFCLLNASALSTSGRANAGFFIRWMSVASQILSPQ